MDYSDATKKQFILKLNIESIISKEKNIDHEYNNKTLEKALKKFLTSNNVYSEKKLNEIISAVIIEFNLDTSDLMDDKLYNMFTKYSNQLKLEENYEKKARSLIKGGAKTLVNQLGDRSFESIVTSVLKGENVRDVTELITRAKLVVSNAAMLELFFSIGKYIDEDIPEYFEYLKKNIAISGVNSENMLISLWTLGLSKKSLDNIVRGKRNLNDYVDNISEVFDDSVENLESTFGKLAGEITLNNKNMKIDWYKLTLLFTAIGSQTLTIRGSDKSTNGKFFEKLILGSSLSLMGFKFLESEEDYKDTEEKAFILSSTDKDERETDATIMYNNKIVTVDIGFIGGGNPEITADKLTRFRSEKVISGIKNEMVPLVIVDTITNQSIIKALAKKLKGEVLEMRDKTWIAKMAQFLSEYFKIDCGYEAITNQVELHKKIDKEITSVNMQEFTNI
ncbi:MULTISPECIES: CfrBI family restriction endonuclease [Staphylococcus]|uniref:CfrBI family restriction endonuclease n=1 Tax=Staphylococcus TaxID=1279 RepID=UPI001188195C|nr:MULTISPECIES: CfrBI family restriction endonuclease [Staphylococcus]MEB8123851.1 CfrBI family restriction endonuclease [Staphylococcus succinus]QDX04580.1 CfrBI family restriction endonuclease [Staphylococcus saprophyticus]